MRSAKRSVLKDTGGLVGQGLNLDSSITFCYATGDVTNTKSRHTSATGGLVGHNNRGTISGCLFLFLFFEFSTEYKI